MKLKDYTPEQIMAKGAVELGCLECQCDECPMHTIDDCMCPLCCGNYAYQHPAEVLKAFGVELPESLADKDAEAVISCLKEQITTQTAKIAELESELNETKSNYVTACDIRDELNDLYRGAVVARDAWKQVAKWLIKQMRKSNE